MCSIKIKSNFETVNSIVDAKGIAGNNIDPIGYLADWTFYYIVYKYDILYWIINYYLDIIEDFLDPKQKIIYFSLEVTKWSVKS